MLFKVFQQLFFFFFLFNLLNELQFIFIKYNDYLSGAMVNILRNLEEVGGHLKRFQNQYISSLEKNVKTNFTV